MTTPVAPAPAPARPGAPGRAEGPGHRSGAEPFASALDGALADRRRPAEPDSEHPAGTDPARGTAATATAAPTGSAEETEAPPGDELAAGTIPAVPAMWALALGQPAVVPAGGEASTVDGVPTGTGVPPVAGAPAEVGVPAPGSPVAGGKDHVAGTAPGRAVADARAQGLAVGLRDGVPPGRAEGEAPGAGEGRGHGPGSAGGPLPVTAAAAAQAQAQLRAALDATTGAPGGTPPDVVVQPAGPDGDPTAGPTAPAAPQQGAVAATAEPLPAVAPAAIRPDGAGPEPDASGGDSGTGQQTTGVPGTAVATSAAPTAPTDADGATGPATATPVSAQVARQVAVLRGAPDGSHTMTLVLTPETLGPVEVSVTVTRGTVDLLLRGAHEHGRAALHDALPELRRDLEAAGLTTSRLEVARDAGGGWLDRHTAGQQAQQGSGDRPGQQGSPEGRSRPWLRPADSGETRSVPTTGATSSGVDVRV